MKFAFSILLAMVACAATVHAQAKEPPKEKASHIADNAYDVVGKTLRPFIGALLGGKNVTQYGMAMRVTITEVSGRLPAEMAGATVDMAFEYPDKVWVSAPVLGEKVTICRNGDSIWGTPGKKVELLLSRFPEAKPAPANRKANSPLYLPVNATEAAFLPALFSIEKTLETATLNGDDCRVIAAKMMAPLAEVLKWEGFRTRVWVAPDYAPRRIEIHQPDFSVTAEISRLKFVPSLPVATWAEPADTADIHRTKSEMIEALLYVVFNSLNLKGTTDR